jgi:hypothetical protein
MSSTSNDSILKQIRANKQAITQGLMLSIDPASNVLGYAVYIDGKLDNSGRIIATPKAPINVRLHDIVSKLPKVKPDVLVIELVRSSTGHVFMVWAVGAIIAHYGAPTIEIPQRMWKEVQDDLYQKDDIADAIYIGRYVVATAKGDNVVLRR